MKDYRQILKNELEQRIKNNPRYSLRAFARDLKLSPSRLSEIIRNKQGLSVEYAKKIATALQLNHAEAESFISLVESSDARSRKNRETAQKRLAQKYSVEKVKLNDDVFQTISDPIHFTIMELTRIKSFKARPKEIAHRLKISKFEVDQAIERLKRLELLAQDSTGKVSETKNELEVDSEVPSASIKNFHSQIIKKSQEAVHTQKVEERELSALVIAVDKNKLPQLKKEVREFRKRINHLIETEHKTKTSVYCLSTQLFRLDHEGEES